VRNSDLCNSQLQSLNLSNRPVTVTRTKKLVVSWASLTVTA